MNVRWFGSLVALAALAACDDGGSDGEGGAGEGGGGTGGPSVPCVVDDHSSIAKALPLTLGTRTTEAAFVCPPRDEDVYSFTLPAGQPLVHIAVGFPAGATSAVDLAYELFEGAALETPLLTVSDTQTTDNRSAIEGRHLLSREGGTYHLRVRDAGNEDQDGRNAYTVLVEAAADPDANEPNDACAQATALVAGAGSGRIGYTGDKDAFSIPFSGTQIVSVTVSSAGTPVDLLATLYDADGNFLNSANDPLGTDGNTAVIRFGVGSDRPLCLVVEDVGGDETDAEVAYSVAVTTEPEPDPNDQVVRNDLPANATPLTPSVAIQGAIASRGDVDYFLLAPQLGKVLDVELDCDGCNYELTVELLRTIGGTAGCRATDTCDFFPSEEACPADGQCDSGVCRAMLGGDRCALGCDGPLDCESRECQESGVVKACAGGGACLVPPGDNSGQCGITQFSVTGALASSQRLATSQPVLTDQRLWLRVRDFKDDQSSTGLYTLRVSVRDDPDAGEAGSNLDNFYMPYNDRAELPDVLRAGRDLARLSPWTDVTDANGVVLYKEATGQGCLGFQGDVDVFRLEGGNPCGTGHCGLTMEWTHADPTRSPIDPLFFLVDRSMNPKAAFQASGQGADRTFGDAACNGATSVECLVYDQEDSDDYSVVVYDEGLDAWDGGGGHCFSFRLQAATVAGCPQSCPVMFGGNGACVCG